MSMSKLSALLLAAALALAPTAAHAVAAISFDTTPGGAGGTITYDGAGGPAIGSGIVFVDVTGVGTPANAGVTLDCVGCSLAFTTGTNISEGPAYQWNGGGTFTLTGAVPGAGIPVATTLLTGSFLTTANTPGLATFGAPALPSGLFIAAGIDTKNITLASFFGLTNPFIFANTEIALGTFTEGADGAFVAVPNQADLINTAPVPMPVTLLLLGGGLLITARFTRARL
jgi:hypothetical protein